MRVDVPAVRIAAVMVAEVGAGEAVVLVEPVDGVFEPVGPRRVGVGVEQDDAVVAGAADRGFGGFAVAVVAIARASAGGS